MMNNLVRNLNSQYRSPVKFMHLTRQKSTKRALVTGGTRGIGFEISNMLLKNNYEVVFTGRTQETVNKALEKYNNSNIQGVVLDMTDRNALKNIPRYCEFETVIHNAGMLSRDELSNMCESRLDKMFLVNTMGPMILAKHCLPYMITKNHGNMFFFCPPYRIDGKTSKLTPYMQTKLAQTTFMFSISDMITRMKISGIKIGGFWTDYPIYTDALIHRKIGNKENCMSPDIISKTVELMLNDNRTNIHGNVIIDRDYLNSKKIDPNNWALGNHLMRLDELFLKN
jgi:short-subunit dehydrogenase